MPGKKDFISIVVNGKKEAVQKRLLLMNLRELHLLLKEAHISVSFSVFCKLRPKNCIIAGASGTHSVCVCTIYQNVKLMLDAINIKKITANFEKPIESYKDCLNEMMCEEPI